MYQTQIEYQTKNHYGLEVKLCKCTHRPGFSYALYIENHLTSYFDNIRDAYREYNFNAR